ncbi:MAG: 4Fe-4S dicluster domain-containing protein [Deltaproteobacteria bacterium]|nr:4Fe-4S dicluster domain-containing protein [Deltaproteobacteria bacterium]
MKKRPTTNDSRLTTHDSGPGTQDSGPEPSAPALDRRGFIRLASAAAASLAIPALSACDERARAQFLRRHFHELSPEEVKGLVKRLEADAKERFGRDCTIETKPAVQDASFGYALDISRCIGCRRCVHACVKENNETRDPEIQWIKVLEFHKDHGIDFPEANPYYCGPNDEDQNAPKTEYKAPENPLSPLNKKQKAILENQDIQYPLYQKADGGGSNQCAVPRQGRFYVPISCQQCRNPPCVKVCPVKATWKEPDGIVVVDYDWCIGCRYCMAACPYGARHFNWGEPQVAPGDINPKMHYLGNRPRRKGVVEKCTFCIQRSRNGQYPVCVEVCPVGARKFGDLEDPESEIRYILEHKRVLILKNELNTRPRFFYFYSV